MNGQICGRTLRQLEGLPEPVLEDLREARFPVEPSRDFNDPYADAVNGDAERAVIRRVLARHHIDDRQFADTAGVCAACGRPMAYHERVRLGDRCQECWQDQSEETER